MRRLKKMENVNILKEQLRTYQILNKRRVLQNKQIKKAQEKIRERYAQAQAEYILFMEEEKLTPNNILDYQSKRESLYAKKEAYLDCMLIVDSIIGGNK